MSVLKMFNQKTKRERRHSLSILGIEIMPRVHEEGFPAFAWFRSLEKKS